MRVGDKVKHIYPPYEQGVVVRIYVVPYPYRILVEVEGLRPSWPYQLFRQDALEKIE